MNLLAKLFNRKSAYVSIEPKYSSYRGDIHYNATFHAAVDCIGRHAAKLETFSQYLASFGFQMSSPAISASPVENENKATQNQN